VKSSTKLGGQAGGQPKSAPSEPPLSNTRTKHNQLLAMIWKLFYDAKKLLQADDCFMIKSN